jgi:hypothetical protein
MYILLDIDGVMVPTKSWQPPILLTDGFPEFSQRAVKVLRMILTNKSTVVLTTSHKSRFTLDEWHLIFSRRGIHLPHLQTLVENNGFLNRREEVIIWLKSNSVMDNFIILDDDTSLNDLPTNMKRHLVLTKTMIGLTEQHIDEIQEKLQYNFLT